MPDDRKIDVSFSARANDVIRLFMEIAPIITWWIEGTFTDKVTGKSIDVGATEPEKLTDELIVPMGEFKVAIRLPEELQSADRLKFDFLDNSFILSTLDVQILFLHFSPGRIPDTFGGQK